MFWLLINLVGIMSSKISCAPDFDWWQNFNYTIGLTETVGRKSLGGGLDDKRSLSPPPSPLSQVSFFSLPFPRSSPPPHYAGYW